MAKFGNEVHETVETEDGESAKHSIHFHLNNGGNTLEVDEFGQLTVTQSIYGMFSKIHMETAFDANNRMSFRELARFFDRVADTHEEA